MSVSSTPGIILSILLMAWISAEPALTQGWALAQNGSAPSITIASHRGAPGKQDQSSAVEDSRRAKLLYLEGNKDFERKDYSNAIETYKKALSIVPSASHIHYNLGMAHLAVGEKKEAAHHLSSYMELRPSAHNANEIKELIRVLGERDRVAPPGSLPRFGTSQRAGGGPTVQARSE